ncbi:hypothetical protein RvY_00488 [Ramazzottius varieornatus]|uniref:Uncharacterized protein n=1 Tax=Ramazzottius varieornatus TaxID=947166 RepID=A0A1D1UCY3_RAMVA|nr:hypothetical protein RvY_00488 [Ramazzottius varieornatus]
MLWSSAFVICLMAAPTGAQNLLRCTYRENDRSTTCRGGTWPAEGETSNIGAETTKLGLWDIAFQKDNVAAIPSLPNLEKLSIADSNWQAGEETVKLPFKELTRNANRPALLELGIESDTFNSATRRGQENGELTEVRYDGSPVEFKRLATVDFSDNEKPKPLSKAVVDTIQDPENPTDTVIWSHHFRCHSCNQEFLDPLVSWTRAGARPTSRFLRLSCNIADNSQSNEIQGGTAFWRNFGGQICRVAPEVTAPSALASISSTPNSSPNSLYSMEKDKRPSRLSTLEGAGSSEEEAHLG